ncbi:VOC family protein [Allokutzneria oryzae]|uniref:VOC family protein n=1 Tax=Allokutzneria oryzae TaxID=1378989 RepID=A0ABV6A4U9_9PSEU
MFRGIATLTFFADDLPAAITWYTELFGVEPYFVRPVDGAPAYAEFRIGDYQHEIGIIDGRFAPHPRTTPGGAVTYWHVDDLTAAIDKLTAMGAKEHEPRIERGPGFVTASVIDPFGNVLGVMHNTHYLDILAKNGLG